MPLGHAWPGCLMPIHRIHVEKLRFKRLFRSFYGLNNFARRLFFILLIYDVQKIWMENSCKSKGTKPIFMNQIPSSYEYKLKQRVWEFAPHHTNSFDDHA